MILRNSLKVEKLFLLTRDWLIVELLLFRNQSNNYWEVRKRSSMNDTQTNSKGKNFNFNGSNVAFKRFVTCGHPQKFWCKLF